MKRSGLLFWVGIGISVLLLLLLLRKIDFPSLVIALRQFDLRCLAAAVFFTFVSYWLRAVRWRYLLLHERPLPLSSLYPAVLIGYMANNLFPARLGEFIRAWVLAEREQLQAPAVFASLVIDRLFDGFSVMVMLAVVLLTLQLPPGMEQSATLLRAGGTTMLLFYAGVVLFLALLKLRPVTAMSLLARLLKPFSVSISEKAIQLAGSFLGGLRFSYGGRDLLGILVSSLLIWISATLPIYLVLLGFGIQLPLTASFFIMVLLVFAVMVPAAPGYIGTYHLACYTGLAAFGLPDTQAISIALVVHGVGFFPVILGGLYQVWSLGMSLGKMRAQATMSGGQ
ncbi:MAG: lysylphosphatidylglycerol synthase transmembrane domain-containing protein [Geobacter sp.]|nr:lysylphosphatidylglycerol synthase transmembrane domain-containing protein [Geobacter sp.]